MIASGVEILSHIFPQISFCGKSKHVKSSEYYHVASSIYSFLCSNQKENGSIYDPYVASTLDHQYHLSHFILSSIIFFITEQKKSYYTRACNCIEYLTSIPLEINRGSLEFNNFPILLSYMLLKTNSESNELIKILRDYISGMQHYGAKSQENPYGNNFLTLRAVNHLLKYKLLGQVSDLELAQDFMRLSMSWQLEDGIFYDYPPIGHNEKGIPSTSYHAKITLMTLLYGLISQESDITNRGLLGLEALTKLTAADGEAFYYGRTNNALYGYACGILALRVAANLMRGEHTSKEFARYERLLFKFCSQNRAEDGHLYIVPNDLESNRCGFDAYMYVTVYNAFAMSMFLLCALIQDPVVHAEIATDPHGKIPQLCHLEQSGFMVWKSRTLSVGFNLKGHNCESSYLLDPRFTGLTPLFLKFKGYDILPSIAFTPHIYSSPKREGLGAKLVRKFREAYEEFRSWSYLIHYNPAYAAFIPFYEGKNSLYLPIDVSASSLMVQEEMLIIKSVAKFVSIRRRGFLPVLIWIASLLSNYLPVSRKKLVAKAVTATNLIMQRTIVIGDNFIHFCDRLTQGKNYKLCFGIRTYTDVFTELKSQQIIFKRKNTGLALLLGQEENIESQTMLCSSKGPSYFWKLTGMPSFGRGGSAEPIEISHTFLPFDTDKCLQKSIRNFYAIAKIFKKDSIGMEIQ